MFVISSVVSIDSSLSITGYSSSLKLDFPSDRKDRNTEPNKVTKYFTCKSQYNVLTL